MNILFCNNHHYERGGADIVYLNTGKLFEQKGHNVSYFSGLSADTLPTEYRKYFIAKYDYNDLNIFKKLLYSMFFIYNPSSVSNLKRLLSNEKPDIAHLHNFYGGLSFSILPVLKKYKIPVVMTVHDYKLICPAYLLLNGKNQVCEKCRGRHYYNTILNKCIKDSYLDSTFVSIESYFRDIFLSYKKYINAFIFVSNFSKEIHLKYSPEIEDRSFTIYNYVQEIPHSDKHPKDIYLYAGRLSKEKGLITLVNVFNNLPHLKLIIAGEGSLYNDLLSMKKDNVELIGFKNQTELKELYARAKYVLMPSEWYENNPLTVLEAFRAGVPVIAANIGGLPEIIHHNKTGFLFESSNEYNLEKTLQSAESLSPEEYQTMQKNCIQYITTNHNSELYYNSLLKIYSNLLKHMQNK